MTFDIVYCLKNQLINTFIMIYYKAQIYIFGIYLESINLIHNLIMLIKAISQQNHLLKFSFYRTFLISSFSQDQKNKYSKSAQAAVFATTVMKTILESQPPKSFQEKSLREKILQLKSENNTIKIDEDVKSHILKIFSSGIDIDMEIFPQHRMEIGLQKEQKKTKVFIFCPNVLVTKKIFSIFLAPNILQSSQINIMITGDFGTSKTVSIMLYIHLSNFVHRFLYQSKYDPQIKQQLKQLIQANLIWHQIPKLFYYSLNMNFLTIDTYQHIMSQLTQLSPNHIQKLAQFRGTADEFKKQIESIYPTKNPIYDSPKNIPLHNSNNIGPRTPKAFLNIYKIIVIDQINKLAQEARIYNQKIDKKQIDLQQKNRIKKALEIIQFFKQCTNRIVFNSSVNIQEQLLMEHRNTAKIGLRFCDDHQKIINQSICFEQDLATTKWGIFDFAHYFWFEVTRSFLHQKQITNKLNQIRKQHMSQIFNSLQIRPYYRKLYVREFLNDEQTKPFFIISEDQTLPTIIEIIKLLAQKFLTFSIRNQGKRLIKFIIKKPSLAKRKFGYLLRFYFLAHKQNQSQQKNNSFEIQKSQFEHFLCEKTSTLGEYNSQVNKQILNRQLLTYQLNKQTVIFTLKPSEFIEIASYALFPVVEQFYPLQIFLDVEKKSFMGCAYESYLLKNLVKNAVISMKWSTYLYSKTKHTYILTNYWTSQNFEICNQQKISFIPLNHKYNHQQKQGKQIFIGSFQRNFQDLFEFCLGSPSKYFIAIPKISKQQRFEKDCSSASIDFVIAKFENYKYMLFTFDTTVRDQKKTANLYSKQNKAEQLFTNFFNQSRQDTNTDESSSSEAQLSRQDQDEQISSSSARFYQSRQQTIFPVDVTHTILSSQEPSFIRPQIYQPPRNFRITYASWRNMKITNSNKFQEGMFAKVVKLLEEEYKLQ